MLFFFVPSVLKNNPANLIALNYHDLFSNTWQKHRRELVMVDKKTKIKEYFMFLLLNIYLIIA